MRKCSRRNSELLSVRTVLCSTQPRQQRGEFRAVLLGEGGKLQSQAGSCCRVPHDGVRADLSLRDKKIKPSSRAGRPKQRGLNE